MSEKANSMIRILLTSLILPLNMIRLSVSVLIGARWIRNCSLTLWIRMPHSKILKTLRKLHLMP